VTQLDPEYQAILGNPDDNALRERYADVLERRGEADRAAFIRLAIEDARLPPPPDDVEDEAWEDRQARLLALMNRHPEWGEGFPKIPGLKWGHGQMLGFRRGLMGCVSLTGHEPFVRGLEKAFGAAPISDVQLQQVDDAGAAAIAASPHLARIRWMQFFSCPLGDAGAQALAASPSAGGLRTLIFHRCQLSPGGATALAASRTLRDDLELWVRHERLDAASIAALRARYPRLSGP
jgi:uncharacterized protein (TIGR02996 family)